MVPFTPRSLPPLDDVSIPNSSTNPEAALRQALRDAQELIRALRSENARLSHTNLESQRIITKLKSTRISRARADYKHARLSTLLHELEQLQTPTRPTALQNYLPDSTITRLARAVHEEEKGVPSSDKRAANLQRCLEILLGATLQCGSQPAVHVGMTNPENGDRIAFDLRWDDDNVEYTRQDAHFSGEVPELAQEHGIQFEIAQGPRFVREILNCMYPTTGQPSAAASPSPQPQRVDPS